MRLLIIHPFFPGGFSSQVEWLLQRDHDVVVIRSQPGPAFMGIKILTANYKPLSSHEDTTHPWAVRFDQGCRRAEATIAAALQLREEDWIPDLIWGHPSWGDLLMIKEVFPTSPVLFFAEYFLQPSGPERDFDSEHCVEDLTDAGLVRLARAQQLMCLEDLEMPYVSTAHAQTTFPSHYQQRIRVLHEGIPTKFFSHQPRAEALDRLRKHGCGLPEDARIVTWVSRGQELSRGFHSFIRSIPHLQKQDPELHIIAVGGDGVHYGKLAPNEEGWKAALLEEVEGEIDTQRLHWLPWSSRGVVRDVYSVSDCHLYLTAPIQLSLSPLEAMSCEAPIVTNRLPQTEEFITDGVEGRFADFFNYEELADTCLAVAQDAAAGRAMGAAGRKKVIDTVDLASIAMPAWQKAMQELLDMRAPE